MAPHERRYMTAEVRSVYLPTMDWRQHISVDPQVMHGTACITGTRIPVSVVLDNLASGMTSDELRIEYPSLTRDSIAAALAYAAELTRVRIIALP
jgi:uncharacterized protein (DUF433 family)